MAVRARGRLNKVLGERIKDARVAAGLTLEGVAKRTGDAIGFNSVYKIEQGTVNITVERLSLIAKAIKVPITTLVKGL